MLRYFAKTIMGKFKQSQSSFNLALLKKYEFIESFQNKPLIKKYYNQGS